MLKHKYINCQNKKQKKTREEILKRYDKYDGFFNYRRNHSSLGIILVQFADLLLF